MAGKNKKVFYAKLYPGVFALVGKQPKLTREDIIRFGVAPEHRAALCSLFIKANEIMKKINDLIKQSRHEEQDLMEDFEPDVPYDYPGDLFG